MGCFRYKFLVIFLVLILFLSSNVGAPDVSKPIINDEIKDIIKDNPNKQTPIIIQLRNDLNKETEDKIKNYGQLKKSRDENLVVADIQADMIEGLDDYAIEKIWLDRETEVTIIENVPKINAPKLWQQGFRGEGIKIAVLDTGVNEGPMLEGRVILHEDFTGNGIGDVNGHGTAVASIIAGSNETGDYNGVAPKAYILDGKVLDNDGRGYLSWLINGIDWAMDPDDNPLTDDGADVISLSLGATYAGDPENLLDAPEILKIKQAVNKGIIVVIASGNCGSGCGSFYGVTTPGISPDAITVGAVDNDNNWASFSSGDYISDFIKPDLVAPGVDIFPSGYSGTSVSTPFVSGGVALLLDSGVGNIKSELERNAVDLGDIGKDVKYGSGLINLDLGSVQEPSGDVSLKIPIFNVDKKDDIVLSFRNSKERRRIKVKFEIEDLDNFVVKEEENLIPKDKSHDFKFKWDSDLVGKHLLRVYVYDGDELIWYRKDGVNVKGNVEDNLVNVQVML